MLDHVYIRAPRPVSRVIFFGNGRFRRVRDGIFADDPRQLRDPLLEIIWTTERDTDSPVLGDTTDRRRVTQKTIVQLLENGRTLTETETVVACAGRRRPDLRVYILR